MLNTGNMDENRNYGDYDDTADYHFVSTSGKVMQLGHCLCQ